MRKNKKVLSLFVALIIMMSFFMTLSISAQDIGVDSKFVPEVQIYEKESLSRMPNYIPIIVSPKDNGTGVDVYIGDVGLDGLDSVTVTVTATGYSTQQSQTSYVPPITGKTFSFDFPMIKCYTEYTVKTKIVDAGEIFNDTGVATLSYSDSILSEVGWNRGTFPTIAATVEHHFNKHGSEVGSTNIVDYLIKSYEYRSEIVSDISNGDTSKYRITTGTGIIPSKKYKHEIDARYIILTNVGNEILSFGR